MKAAVISGPWQLTVTEMPVPRPGPGEVLVKVKYCGICGSDLHFFHLGMPQGLVLGHELTGEVAECGPEVEGWAPGQEVVLNPSYHCEKCYYCRKGQFNCCQQSLTGPGLSMNGGLAQYMTAKTYMLRNLPTAVGARSGALVEPLAVALRAVSHAGLQPGDTVLVVGAGTVGLFVAAHARTAGAKVLLMEKNKVRRDLALRLAAGRVLGPEEMSAIYAETEAGVDTAFECSGSDAGFTTCFKAVRSGGGIVVVGLNFAPQKLDLFSLMMKEIKIQGSYAFTREFDLTLALLEQGALDAAPYISKEVPLEEAEEAFKELSGESGLAKVLVKL